MLFIILLCLDSYVYYHLAFYFNIVSKIASQHTVGFAILFSFNVEFDCQYVAFFIADFVGKFNSSVEIVSIETWDESASEILLEFVPGKFKDIFAVQFLYFYTFLFLLILNNTNNSPDMSFSICKTKNIVMSIQIIKFFEAWFLNHEYRHTNQQLKVILNNSVIIYIFLLREGTVVLFDGLLDDIGLTLNIFIFKWVSFKSVIFSISKKPNWFLVDESFEITITTVDKF